MDLFDFYYRQIVSQSVLDWAFDRVQAADKALSVDNAMSGILGGLGATENSPTPNLTINVAGGTAYDLDGQRCAIGGTSNSVDCSVDEYGASTTVSAAPNERWLSVFVRFKRSLTEPAIDGNALTVYTKQLEDAELFVRQAAESPLGTDLKPAALSDAILLCDVKLVYGQTQILNAHIDTDRRQDWVHQVWSPPYVIPEFVTPHAKWGFYLVMEYINQHVPDIVYPHTGGSVGFTFSDLWYGAAPVLGSSPPPITVAAALDAIVYDLAKQTSVAGAERIGAKDYTAPLGTGSWASKSVQGAIEAVAESLDAYQGAIAKWKPLVTNFVDMVNGDPASIAGSSHILYHPLYETWIVFGVGNPCPIHAMPHGNDAGLAGLAHTITSQNAAQSFAIDTTRYLIGKLNGDIEYGTGAAVWATELAAAIGLANIAAVHARYPTDDLTCAIEGAPPYRVSTAPVGVGGGWILCTTPPPIVGTGAPRDIHWLSGSTWMVLSSNPDGSPTSNQTFLSTDDGANWAATPTKPADAGCVGRLFWIDHNPLTGTICISGHDGSVGGAFGQSCIVRSTDNGATWSLIYPTYAAYQGGATNQLTKLRHIDGPVWVAVGDDNIGGQAHIVASFDDGATWKWVGQNKLDSSSGFVSMEGIDKSERQIIVGGAQDLSTTPMTI